MSVRHLISIFIIHSIVLCFITISNGETQELSLNISRFGADLYQECASQSIDKNIIMSPFSIAIALALLSQGAHGNTFEQIAHGLHLEANKTAIANRFALNNDLLRKSAGQSTLLIANQLYIGQTFQIKQSFRDVAESKFKSGIETINFTNYDAAARTINSFVENATNNKIKDFVKPGPDFACTALIIVNAIYFKGTWEKEFRKSDTSPDDFYLDAMNIITVDFMRKTEYYRFIQMKDFKASALELRYKNSNISFVAILPNSKTGLAALEASIANVDLMQITSKMRVKEVDIKLPKFKIESEIKLNDILKNLGMTDMFGETAALGGLLDSSQPLKVSEATHKAFIEVNEEGSEAAAATGLRVVPYSSEPPPPPELFHADHPFLYYILDRNSNTVFFTGRCIKIDDKMSTLRELSVWSIKGLYAKIDSLFS